MPGGVFIQSESEIAAINMVLGASVAGARAMTSSSSPGISLKQEGISYLAADELPAVIVNMSRGGPGMGNISPAQSDYFQATRGGGHGDYRTIVLAPSSVQEIADLMPLAFDLADRYRNPVVVLGDGMLGQMMEPVSFDGIKRGKEYVKDYILTGAEGRPSRMVQLAPLRREGGRGAQLEALQEIPAHGAERSALRNAPDRRRGNDSGCLRHGREDRERRHQAAQAGAPQGGPYPPHHPLALPEKGHPGSSRRR